MDRLEARKVELASLLVTPMPPPIRLHPNLAVLFAAKVDDLAAALNMPEDRAEASLFDQIWHDPERLEDVTAHICDHIASVYQENSPERIYFLILFNIFNEFLEDLSEDVLPNDLTGYKDTLVWQKLYPFQRDAVTGIINKLETYNGCILADSVGLGKTFSALAVTRYDRGRPIRSWQPKRDGERNEALDTFVYATAALHGLVAMGLRLNDEAVAMAMLPTRGAPVTAGTAPGPRPALAPIRSRWMG